uniref:Uncharacterized protein n=1 Tax=Cannabis sativa TaxID=3483 RepID=A0A803PKI0_CANSA
MLDVTLDLISQTASSSLFAFCFCNLIIVIILLGSKPVNSAHDQKQSDHAPPLSVVSIPKTVTHDDEAVKHNGLGMEERDVLEVNLGVGPKYWRAWLEKDLHDCPSMF